MGGDGNDGTTAEPVGLKTKPNVAFGLVAISRQLNGCQKVGVRTMAHLQTCM